MTNCEEHVATLCRQARVAATSLAATTNDVRSKALSSSATRIRQETSALLDANAKDLEAGRAAGLTEALIDRLTLDSRRIEAIAAGLETVAALADPLEGAIEEWTAPSGIRIRKVPIPSGGSAVL